MSRRSRSSTSCRSAASPAGNRPAESSDTIHACTFSYATRRPSCSCRSLSRRRSSINTSVLQYTEQLEPLTDTVSARAAQHGFEVGLHRRAAAPPVGDEKESVTCDPRVDRKTTSPTPQNPKRVRLKHHSPRPRRNITNPNAPPTRTHLPTPTIIAPVVRRLDSHRLTATPEPHSRAISKTTTIRILQLGHTISRVRLNHHSTAGRSLRPIRHTSPVMQVREPDSRHVANATTSLSRT